MTAGRREGGKEGGGEGGCGTCTRVTQPCRFCKALGKESQTRNPHLSSSGMPGHYHEEKRGVSFLILTC